MPDSKVVAGFASSLRRSSNYGYVDFEQLSPATSVRSEAISSVKSIRGLRSTPSQTVFNAINVLIGLGLLSLPLGFHYAGWVLGLFCFTCAALATRYTAILLGRILDRYPDLNTYSDIGALVVGQNFNRLIKCTFLLDLMGAGVSMVVLFADSMGGRVWKIAICSLLFFLNFLPLSVLSFLSFLGILCTSAVVVLVFVCGLLQSSPPGSLLSPVATNLWPSSWVEFFVSLGIFMAPWGGHVIFPELKRDMHSQSKYPTCVDITFAFAYTTDAVIGALGFLMYGEGVLDEITQNLLLNKGLPKWVKTLIMSLICFIPLAKLPLVSRPILSIWDAMIQKPRNSETEPLIDPQIEPTSHNHRAMFILGRFFLSAVFLILSFVFSKFGKIMSLIGSAICILICIILPLYFHMILLGDTFGVWKRRITWSGIVLCGILSICGTISVCIV
ncbi:unnamed protein product [Kuraishia capsulata CBS 1993]|uniref:Amino acid transporter transmembrane domain-containing protein n=1 Tax=Kuraishia capsulata CBS 1993 TaxID=1382522 RepID=W6MVE0_9ASCO|nr:uncharacterized protein KUCA_T00002206001 [Kuraishia capsulata CBS 1993]CDK26235.1 unnamed protein product [Kuraishia capsulata CBS 1993]